MKRSNAERVRDMAEYCQIAIELTSQRGIMAYLED